jgi:hypothetical protein
MFSVFAFIQSVNHDKDLLEAITHKVTEVVQKLVKLQGQAKTIADPDHQHLTFNARIKE